MIALASSFFIDNFFKLANFGIILGLYAYIFNTYVLESVKEQMKQKTDQEAAVRLEITTAEQQQREKKSQLEQDLQQLTLLYEQVQQWHRLFEQQENQRQVLEKNQQELFARNLQKQQRQVSLMRLNELVIPRALDQAQIQLKKQYEHDSGRRMMNQLLTFMRSKKS